MVAQYLIGQRLYSINEPQLGLGIVADIQARRLEMHFPLCNETRVYATESAQLSRFSLSLGDPVVSEQGLEFTLARISEENGLLYFHSADDELTLCESQLASQLQISLVEQQLLQGQVEQNKWYEFRLSLLQSLHQQAHSPTQGLLGARTSLLAHQLYIAQEVSSRYAPRVLLADEVGMGKTIEAGLILHRQLHMQRIERVLILVPPALLHQWLVEMLRKFNLNISLFDEERYHSELENGSWDNPFEAEQLILSSIGMVVGDNQIRGHILATQWDMVIVDEAHHLYWSEQQQSDEYSLVEALANTCRSLLLLTGTPEQSGSQGHFARLRLLDPSRFHTLSQFEHEEQQYLPLARLLGNLNAGKEIAEADIELLKSMGISEDQAQLETDEIVQQLIDRHGTGRVLFRNSRANVEGFPKRLLHSYSLPCPDEYSTLWEEQKAQEISARCADYLSPEVLLRQIDPKANWLKFDPRVDWLISLLNKLKPAKVLIITAQQQTALELSAFIRKNTGIRLTAFHEDMSIMERDRAAAYFASSEDGAQAMVCSEIGSEGRNFQFAQNLVLFDLPEDPDLLEQRIGRLDRIGQAAEIHIHVPYLQDSFLNFYHDWYHVSLNAFTQHCPSAHACYQAYVDELRAIANSSPSELELQDLLQAAADFRIHKNAEFESGRDQLLELNSFNRSKAHRLKSLCAQADDAADLKTFLNDFFDYIGIESEIHSPHSLVIKPGEHMRISQFPGLPEDGMVICFEREHALSHDDWGFMTWEHPFVLSAIDYILVNQVASTTVCAVKARDHKPGQLLLEAVYLLDPKGNKTFPISRYLPSSTITLVCDQDGRLVKDANQAIVMNAEIHINEEMVQQIVSGHREQIKQLIDACAIQVNRQVPEIKREAANKVSHEFEAEIERLLELQRVNASIRDDEIRFFRDGLVESLEIIDNAGIRLDSLRLMITT